jgi:chromosome segregation ATPase
MSKTNEDQVHYADFYHTLNTMLWHLACDVGRSPPERASALVSKALSDIMRVVGPARLEEGKCPSEWSKSDIEKHNLKCALASLEEAIKQRDGHLLALERSHQERGELSAALASTKELLANRNADVDLARKERDAALAAVARLEQSHCILINKQNDLQNARAEAQAETLQARTAWAHVVDERDQARRELAAAYSDRNVYHVALDKVVKLAVEIRRVADGFSTK